ncbi:hypothetical protein FQN57_000717 [Myotisia sp. PD_48]|nr:hypothetical protein FQN57_000717 [Myotisia sp. PD_48]
MLDEGILAPRMTLPGNPDELALDSEPVFLLQANFINGGLIHTFVGQHNTMDMTGQGHLISLLSKACRGEEFTPDEISSGNLARHNIIPLRDEDYEPGPEIDHQIIKLSDKPDASGREATPTGQTDQPPTFTISKLLESLPSDKAPYISTDDAVSAFIWQSVMRARIPRLNPALECTFARAVDVRPFLNIPRTYPGLVQNMTYHTSPLRAIIDWPLGVAAAQLRSALNPQKSTLA